MARKNENETVGHQLVYILNEIDRFNDERLTAQIATDLLLGDKGLSAQSSVEQAQKIVRLSKQAVAEERGERRKR